MDDLNLTNFNLTTDHPNSAVTPFCIMLPVHLSADIIKMVVLVIIFVCGATINLCALEHMRHNPPPSCVSSQLQQMHLLKRHLNLSDLLIIFVYGLSELIWFYTYNWRASDLVCKLVAYGRTFVFYASSNLIASIALCRLLSIVSPLKSRDSIKWRTYRVLFCSWSMAFICSAPQFIIWLTVDVPLCGAGHSTWSQCSTIWDVEQYRQLLLLLQGVGNVELPFSQDTYNIGHLIFLFWIPLTIIIVSYIGLLCVLTHADNPNAQYSNSYGNTTDTEADEPMEPKSIMRLNIVARLPVTETGNVLSQNNTGGNTDQSSRSRQHHLSRQRHCVALHVSIRLTIVYLCCYVPYAVLTTMKIIYGAHWYSENAQQIDAVNVFLLLNAVINPFVYGTFTSDYVPSRVLGTSHRIQRVRFM